MEIESINNFRIKLGTFWAPMHFCPNIYRGDIAAQSFTQHGKFFFNFLDKEKSKNFFSSIFVNEHFSKIFLYEIH